MLLLVLTVCSLVSPDRCADTRLQLTDVSPMQCAIHGQEAAAQWLDGHPGVRVARWRCVDPAHEGSPT